MKTHFQDLDEQGFTILEDLLTPQQLDEAVAELKDIYQREKYAVSLYEPKASRAVNLTARAEIFRERSPYFSSQSPTLLNRS